MDFSNSFSVDVLSLNDLTGITSGISAPNVSPGVDLPIGSLYLHQDQGNATGRLWKKNGPTATDWVEIGSSLVGSGAGLTGRVLAHDIIQPITGTTIIRLDTRRWKYAHPDSLTAPTINEGTELWTATVTPSSTSSILEINTCGVTGYAYGSRYVGYPVVFALFRDNVCIGSTTSAMPGYYSFVTNFNWSFRDTPSTTTPVTYSVRIGLGGQATTRVNKQAIWAFNYLLLKDRNKVVGQGLGGMLAKTGYIVTEY